ncbi:MAG: TAXI family TRAP transporter solute-binding subunit [Microcoleaceae cyanobacterium]
MQNRQAIPIILISIITAVIFAMLSWRNPKQIYYLTLATGGKTGEYYAFGQALATVVNQHQPRIKINVIETAGSLENIDLLYQNKAQLALIQSNSPIRPTVKAVAFLFPEVFHLIATTESKIQSVSDLKGKRIALMPEGSGSYQLFWPLSQHYGLTEQDFQAIPLAPTQAHTALKQGQVDALFQIIALGNSAVSQLLQTEQNRLVPIDQAAALQLLQPALEASTIPKGTYNGAIPIPSQDLSVVSVRSVMVTSKNTDSWVINEITRILYEARNDLVAKTPQAALINPPDSNHQLGFSFHPGALLYYQQDEPSFLEKYAETMGFILSLSVLLVSSFWQFKVWLKGRQKNRADFYNLEILNLIEQIHGSNSLEQLQDLRSTLFTILNEVVIELDTDRISPESFQSFTFTWQTAVAEVRHQETILRN